MMNYESANGCFPLGAAATNPSQGWGAWDNNGFTWRVLILPQLEQTALFNSLNFSLHEGSENGAEQATAWYTKVNAFVCPSDGFNTGILPANIPTGQYPMYGPPTNPNGGGTGVVSVNYHLSHGDNITVQGITPGTNPWETPCGTNANPQIGYAGFWGTTYDCGVTTVNGGGQMRGFSDYRTGRFATIATVTDGLSNTLLVGETLPEEDANNEFYTATSASMGITVPLNWNTKRVTCTDGGTFGTVDLGCRFSYAAHGFKSKHPGGVNFVFGDGSVHFIKNTISRATIAALGSRSGGEVISADAY
jgi:prepilin-type processing-associated H-X9-DG protein